MRTYNYKDKWEKFLTPQIVTLLTQIHEYKGKQNLFIETKPDILTHLADSARIQSTESSNRIEGIYTSDDRIKRLALTKTNPVNRAEEDIAGYREVLNTINLYHDNIDLTPGVILQLHRDMNKFNASAFGGKFKNTDNVIDENDECANKTVRFQPFEARAVPNAVSEICAAYNNAVSADYIDPLLAIPMFILDFLCIHPFNDGNGRISRLLTLFLLYRSGYIMGKYISIERIIEDTKEQYYDSLQKSSFNWHEGENDYVPFVRYMLDVFIAAHREFASRVDVLVENNISKPERVAKIIEDKFGVITKQEIKERCPDISETTIQRALGELVKKNKIKKISGGRYTSYYWNREDE